MFASTCLLFLCKASSTLGDKARFIEPESCTRGSTARVQCANGRRNWPFQGKDLVLNMKGTEMNKPTHAERKTCL